MEKSALFNQTLFKSDCSKNLFMYGPIVKSAKTHFITRRLPPISSTQSGKVAESIQRQEGSKQMCCGPENQRLHTQLWFSIKLHWLCDAVDSSQNVRHNVGSFIALFQTGAGTEHWSSPKQTCSLEHFPSHPNGSIWFNGGLQNMHADIQCLIFLLTLIAPVTTMVYNFYQSGLTHLHSVTLKTAHLHRLCRIKSLS